MISSFIKALALALPLAIVSSISNFAPAVCPVITGLGISGSNEFTDCQSWEDGIADLGDRQSEFLADIAGLGVTQVSSVDTIIQNPNANLFYIATRPFEEKVEMPSVEGYNTYEYRFEVIVRYSFISDNLSANATYCGSASIEDSGFKSLNIAQEFPENRGILTNSLLTLYNNYFVQSVGCPYTYDPSGCYINLAYVTTAIGPESIVYPGSAFENSAGLVSDMSAYAHALRKHPKESFFKCNGIPTYLLDDVSFDFKPSVLTEDPISVFDQSLWNTETDVFINSGLLPLTFTRRYLSRRADTEAAQGAYLREPEDWLEPEVPFTEPFTSNFILLNGESLKEALGVSWGHSLDSQLYGPGQLRWDDIVQGDRNYSVRVPSPGWSPTTGWLSLPNIHNSFSSATAKSYSTGALSESSEIAITVDDSSGYYYPEHNESAVAKTQLYLSPNIRYDFSENGKFTGVAALAEGKQIVEYLKLDQISSSPDKFALRYYEIDTLTNLPDVPRTDRPYLEYTMDGDQIERLELRDSADNLVRRVDYTYETVTEFDVDFELLTSVEYFDRLETSEIPAGPVVDGAVPTKRIDYTYQDTYPFAMVGRVVWDILGPIGKTPVAVHATEWSIDGSGRYTSSRQVDSDSIVSVGGGDPLVGLWKFTAPSFRQRETVQVLEDTEESPKYRSVIVRGYNHTSSEASMAAANVNEQLYVFEVGSGRHVASWYPDPGVTIPSENPAMNNGTLDVGAGTTRFMYFDETKNPSGPWLTYLKVSSKAALKTSVLGSLGTYTPKDTWPAGCFAMESITTPDDSTSKSPLPRPRYLTSGWLKEVPTTLYLSGSTDSSGNLRSPASAPASSDYDPEEFSSRLILYTGPTYSGAELHASLADDTKAPLWSRQDIYGVSLVIDQKFDPFGVNSGMMPVSIQENEYSTSSAKSISNILRQREYYTIYDSLAVPPTLTYAARKEIFFDPGAYTTTYRNLLPEEIYFRTLDGDVGTPTLANNTLSTATVLDEVLALYSYDSNGNLTRTQYKTSLGQTVSDSGTVTYDEFGRITSTESPSPLDTQSDFIYNTITELGSITTQIGQPLDSGYSLTKNRFEADGVGRNIEHEFYEDQSGTFVSKSSSKTLYDSFGSLLGLVSRINSLSNPTSVTGYFGSGREINAAGDTTGHQLLSLLGAWDGEFDSLDARSIETLIFGAPFPSLSEIKDSPDIAANQTGFLSVANGRGDGSLSKRQDGAIAESYHEVRSTGSTSPTADEPRRSLVNLITKGANSFEVSTTVAPTVFGEYLPVLIDMKRDATSVFKEAISYEDPAGVSTSRNLVQETRALNFDDTLFAATPGTTKDVLGVSRFTYDGAGRIVTRTVYKMKNAVTNPQTESYSSSDELFTLEYGYDSIGRIDRIACRQGTASISSIGRGLRIFYDELGRVESEEYYAADDPYVDLYNFEYSSAFDLLVRIERTYDEAGRPATMSWFQRLPDYPSPILIRKYTYSYNELGLIKKIVQLGGSRVHINSGYAKVYHFGNTASEATAAGSLESKVTREFEYDSLGKLLSEERLYYSNATPTAHQTKMKWTYSYTLEGELESVDVVPPYSVGSSLPSAASSSFGVDVDAWSATEDANHNFDSMGRMTHRADETILYDWNQTSGFLEKMLPQDISSEFSSIPNEYRTYDFDGNVIGVRNSYISSKNWVSQSYVADDQELSEKITHYQFRTTTYPVENWQYYYGTGADELIGASRKVGSAGVKEYLILRDDQGSVALTLELNLEELPPVIEEGLGEGEGETEDLEEEETESLVPEYALIARPVESVQYDPYGTPSIHSRNGDGTAYLRVYNETKTSTFSSGLVTSNTREGDPYSNYLSAQFSPLGATGLSTRVPGSVALSSIGLKFLYLSRPWTPVGELYHLRNRWYAPVEARFISRDPISLEGGTSLYMYCGGNPINYSDPTGLAWGEDLAAVGDQVIGFVENKITIDTDSQILAVWNGAAGTAADIARGGPDLLRFGQSFAEMYEGYSSDLSEPCPAALSGWQRAGRALEDIGRGLALIPAASRITTGIGKGVGKINCRFRTGGWNCFVADTGVWTPEGMVPIQNISVGNEVIAFDEHTGDFVIGTVSQVFESIVDGVVGVQSGDTEIRCTSEHPFLRDGEWVTASSLATAHYQGPTTVYNFEVGDIHTYLVSPEMEIVHNTWKCVPNPHGKLGSPAHRAKVAEIVDAIKARGNVPYLEHMVETPGGAKNRRFIDVLEEMPSGQQIGHQVGRLNASGTPVARERIAMEDVFRATRGKIFLIFHPYY